MLHKENSAFDAEAPFIHVKNVGPVYPPTEIYLMRKTARQRFTWGVLYPCGRFEKKRSERKIETGEKERGIRRGLCRCVSR